MKRERSLLKAFAAAAGLVLIGLAWLIFSPIQFGGRSAYVIVTGNSMEPTFHQGDLVIMQWASEYQPGDIATYRHPQLGPVIHRLIGREEGRFVFKGDHNDWIDAYRPEQADLIGKFWLHLPRAGKVVERFRTPWVVALLAGVIGVTGLTAAASNRAQSRRGRRAAKEGHRPMSHLHQSKTDLIFALAILALTSLGLALFAYTRPLTRTVVDTIAYEQLGRFSYATTAPPGIYEADMVQSGEPIFRQLITKVNINFDYQFEAARAADLTGAYRLVAEIRHSNGWSRTIELQPETTFAGNNFSAQSILDLSQAQALINSVEQQTGLRQQQYTLALYAEVTTAGSLAGQALQDTFRPVLLFYLDELQMRLAADSPSPTSDAPDPFKTVQTGLIEQTRQMPNTIPLLSFQLQVSTARYLALAGLALALAGSAALGGSMWQATRGDEAARIQLKYGSLLVAVRRRPPHPGGEVEGEPFQPGEQHEAPPLPPQAYLLEDYSAASQIEVASIDDLAKIAERNGRMILRQGDGSTHHYFVQDSGVIYYYRAGAASQESTAAEEGES